MTNPQVQTSPSDTTIVPRSQARILTDDGVITREQVAEELGGMGTNFTPADVADEPEPQTQTLTEEPPNETSTTTTDEDKLNAILDGLEQPPADTETETQTEEGTFTPPDFDSPEIQELATQFKEKMGVDLKEAYERYMEATDALTRAQQQAEQVTAQQTVVSLQKDWGVNDAEFNRRVEAVLAYTERMTPEQRAQFDSVEGIKLIYARLANDKGKQAVKSGGGVSPRKTESAPTFKKSELMQMMIHEPQRYSALQSKIKAAYAAGTVVNDI